VARTSRTSLRIARPASTKAIPLETARLHRGVSNSEPCLPPSTVMCEAASRNGRFPLYRNSS
jgi:hypothetical protein